MKRFILFAILSLSSICANAQTLDWANLLKGDGHEVDAAMSIDVKSNGDVYVCGYFYDTVDFDPGPGVNQMIPVGDNDIFFAKYDYNGNLAWCKSIGAPSSPGNGDIALSIVTNSSSIYIAGWYSGTADFDPSLAVHNLTSTYYQDGFVARYDLNGNFIWVKSIDPPFTKLELDLNENLCLIGNFDTTVDFDPGINTYYVSTSNPACFVLRLDSVGNFIDVKTLIATIAIGINDISFDQLGAMYLLGVFYGTADFDMGSGIYNLSTFDSVIGDNYILKSDANGNFNWVNKLAGIHFSGGIFNASIDAGNSNNLYVTGEFKGTVDFDPGLGTNNITALGGLNFGNAFLSKFDSMGNFLWTKTFDSHWWVQNCKVHVQNANNTFVYGAYMDSLDINPGPGQNLLTSNGNVGVFAVKLDSAGNYVNSLQISTTSYIQTTTSITTDPSGNIYIAGGISDTVCFDPTHNDTMIVISQDIFFAKYNMNSVGLIKLDQNPPLSAFPNPTSGKFTIILGEQRENITTELSNILGQSIVKEQKQNASSILMEIPGPAGLYFVTITDSKGYKSVVKAIKE